MNAYGMQKLSDFLSDYIVENYNIAPRTDDADLVDWCNQGIEDVYKRQGERAYRGRIL